MNQFIKSKLFALERLMIPILIILIVLAGSFRMYPWLKTQWVSVFSSETGLVVDEGTVSEEGDVEKIEVSLAPDLKIISKPKPVQEVRSQDLTNSLVESELEVAVQTDIPNSIQGNNKTLTAEQIKNKRAEAEALKNGELVTRIVKNMGAKKPMVSVSDTPSHTMGVVAKKLEQASVVKTQAEVEAEKLMKGSSKTDLSSNTDSSSSAVQKTAVSEISTKKPEPLTVISNQTGFVSITEQIQSTAGPDASFAAVQSALRQWQAAWADKDVSAYTAAYIRNYAPSDQSHEVWKAQRTDRINSAEDIRLSISGVQQVLNSAQKVVLLFEQRYTSATYSDVTKKRMMFVKQNGQWLIAKESVEH